MTTRQRSTRQGAAIEAVLAGSEGFRSAQELHASLRTAGDSVGLTTVYRHLSLLAANGTVDVVLTDAGEAMYRLCQSAQHHHHLVCRECGASVEINGPEVEAWTAKVAQQAGYREVTHTIEIFGTCSLH